MSAKIRSRAIGTNYTKAPCAEAVEWQLKGLCASSKDPDLWLVPPSHRREVEQAKAICAVCPVVEQCLQWSMDTHQEFGIWGGLSEVDRQMLWGERTSRRRYHRVA